MSVAPAPHLRRAGLAISIASVTAITFATLSPQHPEAAGSVFCLVCGDVGGVDAILNVLLFAPLGIGLALCEIPAKRALPAMCALSALIEIAQFFVIPGRYASIGDVVTNSLGGALGFAIARYAFTLRRPSPRIAVALSVCWSIVWLLIQTVSAFGFSPALTESEYFGQIAPDLGNFDPFRGEVVRAGIGDLMVPGARFADSHRVRKLLLGGAMVTTTIIPARSQPDIAPIVRVADADEREILLLAQNASNLVFGVRTGAAVLRLRSPYFALPDVFPAVSRDHNSLTTDTLRLSGRYSAREVWMGAQARTSNHRRIPVTASLGWTMLLPFQWAIEGTNTELVLSLIWIVCLLLPLGYWGLSITQLSRGRDATRIRMAALPIALLLLYVGLVLLPRMFGVNTAPLSNWVAALTAMLVGGAVATRQSY